MHPIKSFVGVAVLAWSVGAEAATQRILMQEGFNTRACIARNHLNHIAIERDRIVNVKALQGQFELDKDSELGHIFLKPLEGAPNPLSLFLTTESGKTYSVELSLEDQSPQSIVLVAPLPPEPPAPDHLAQLQAFITALHRGEVPKGFMPREVHQPIRLSKSLKGHITQIYQGSDFKIEVLALRNVGWKTLFLNELDFYQESMQAISMRHRSLAPKAFTTVYRVRS